MAKTKLPCELCGDCCCGLPTNIGHFFITIWVGLSCLMLPFGPCGVYSTHKFVLWKVSTWQRNVYLLCCFLQLGSAIAAAVFDGEKFFLFFAYWFYIFPYFIAQFATIICSCVSVLAAIYFCYLTSSIIHSQPHNIGMIVVLVVFLLAYIAAFGLSIKYRWLIFNSGSSLRFICFKKCPIPICASICANMGMCFYSKNRELRIAAKTFTMYHETPKENVPSIKENGFQPSPDDGKTRLLGSGIYFATKPPHTSLKSAPSENEKVVLVAEIKVGKIKYIPSANAADRLLPNGRKSSAPAVLTWLNEQGYDSTWIRTRTGPEFVVYSSDQTKFVKVMEDYNSNAKA